MRMKDLTSVSAFLAICLGMAGCNAERSAVVSGTVTFDGQPIEDGVILFSAADGGSTTKGGIIAQGRYRVTAPQGLLKVTIRAAKVIGKKKLYGTADSPEVPVKTEALPGKYNARSELQLEVGPGTNDKDWDLRSR